MGSRRRQHGLESGLRHPPRPEAHGISSGVWALRLMDLGHLEPAAETGDAILQVPSDGQPVVRTHQDVAICFSMLPAGAYRLIARHSDHVATASGQVAVASGGDDPPFVLLQLRDGAVVQGQVLRDGGTGPLEGTATLSLPGEARTSLVSDGKFSFRGVPPGTHSLEFRHGATRATTSVVVPEGAQEVSQDIVADG